MTQQVQTYYDRLACSGRNTGSTSFAPTPGIIPRDTALAPNRHPKPIVDGPTDMQHRTPRLPEAPPGTPNEFSSWLLYGSRSHPISVVPSPSCTPALSETATTATSAFWSPDPYSFPAHVRERSGAACMQISELLESPVLRSRNPTYDVSVDAGPQTSTSTSTSTGTCIVQQNEGGRVTGPQVTPAFAQPSSIPSAPAVTDFVHEYMPPSASITKPAALQRQASNFPAAAQNTTIFIAEPGSENYRVQGGAGVTVQGKGTGTRRPRVRQPAQKGTRMNGK